MSAPMNPSIGRHTRTIAALVMAPVAILAVLWLPTPILAALIAAVMMVGLWEWTLLSGLRRQASRAAYLAVNAGLIAGLAWSSPRGNLFPLELASVIGVAWWLLALAWLARFDWASGNSWLSRSAKLVAGSLAVVPAWCALSWLHAGSGNGPAWTLFALFVVWGADTGAYFVGVRFGRRKLAPKISPGKTWEGFWGGLGLSLLLSAAAWPLLGLAASQWPALAMITLVTALASVLGDLVESLLKRHAGIKDSSDLIPGHGGVLDRLDSVLAALPVFVVAKLWLGL
jgi:phosphatidate cytidylyltransferase